MKKSRGRYLTWLLVLACVAGLAWAAGTIFSKVTHNRAVVKNIAEEERGWAAYHKRQALDAQYTGWSYSLKPSDYMADTQITDSYNFSCTMGVYNQDQSPLMTSAALKLIRLRIDSTNFYIEDISTVGGWPPGTVPPGAGPGFVFQAYWWDVLDDPILCPDINNNRYGPASLYKWIDGDCNWQWELDITLTATGSHIDSTRAVVGHMGSDTPPTHSNEMTTTDVWEADVACGTVTWDFGGMGSHKPNCGDCIGTVVSPATVIEFFGEMHKSVAGTTVYGKWSDIQVSNIPLQLDGLEDQWGGTIFTVGRGANLEIETRDFNHSGAYPWSNGFAPPKMANWTMMGLADFKEIAHNSKYDNALVHGGFLKVAYMPFTWPTYEECDLAGAGVIPDDSPSPVRIGELHAVSDYVERYAPYATWDFVPGYTAEFWNGGLALRVDTVSAQAHNLPTFAGDYIIFGEGGLNRTDNISDPTFTVQAALNDTDFDLGGPLGHRASAWDSTDFVPVGGGIGTAANFSFTVPAGGGTLYRDLVDIWLPRCLHMIAGPCFADFEVASWWHQANTTPGGGWGCAWADYDHDVYDWSAYRHLQVSATPSAAPAGNPQLRLTYHIPAVTNNHNTPAGWTATASLGPAQTITFTGQYDSGVIWFDMARDATGVAERPWLKHVSKVELIFPAESGAITWTVSGVDLVKHNAADPDRGEVLPHAAVTFHEPRNLYAAGGARAYVDGLSRYQLCMVENYNVYSGHEQLVEHIHWAFGNPSGLDLSAAWGLSQYCDVITQSTQGWAWALPANWDTLTLDANLDRYTLGYSFDLKELQDFVVDGGGYECMFKVYAKTVAAGLMNKPWGVMVVQGGIHGLSNKRSGCCGKLYRREAGSGDPWTLYADDIASDGHAYWWHGGDLIHHYTGAVPTYYEHRVNLAGFTDIARLYERQWEWAWLIIRGIGACAVTLDADRVPWYAWVSGNDILVKQMTAQYTTFSAPITVDNSGDYDFVDIAHDGRLMVVTARNATTEELYQFHSVNQGDNWTGPTLVG